MAGLSCSHLMQPIPITSERGAGNQRETRALRAASAAVMARDAQLSSPRPVLRGRLFAIAFLRSSSHSCVQVLLKDIVDLGRKSSCVIQIKHPAVSGIHCEINNRGQGEVWIKDLSTNGTFINSAPIGKSKAVLLNDGDEIVLIKSTSEKIGYKFILQETAKKELVSARADDRRRSLAMLRDCDCVTSYLVHWLSLV